jgi:predicted RNA binding protein YcfA (HicA-like mRNA interferase family)
MMPGLPAIKYRKLHHFILGMGYELQHATGSHERYFLKSHTGGDGNLTIARHREIPEGTLMSVLNDISVQTGMPLARLKEMIEAG